MGLSAMMRLVIEEMGEYFPPRLPLRRAILHSIVQNFLESRLCQALHKPYDSAVFLYSRSVQRRQVVESRLGAEAEIHADREDGLRRRRNK